MILPLTEAQTGLFYAQRLDPANPTFNTGQYLDLRGPLDLSAFRAAVDQAGAEADALSLRLVDRPDGPMQYIDPLLSPRLQLIDLSQTDDPHGAALDAIAADMATPVGPCVGPLAAQHLYRLGPDRHLWALRVHHIVNDGYGMVLLTGRIAALYKLKITGGTAIDRPFARLDGVLAEDAAYCVSAQRQVDADWWRDAMAGMDDVGGIKPGRAMPAHHCHRYAMTLPPKTRADLLALAEHTRLPWPDVLTALVAAYTHRFGEGDGIVIGVPHMGRFGSASARIPAMVMNVLPVRIMPDEQAPLGSWLATIARQLGEARAHGRYRSEQLRRDLGLLGGNRRLYGPLVNVQPYDRPPLFHGLDVMLHVTGTGPVEDIHFTFRGDCIDNLTLEIDANPDLYDADEVAAHGLRLALFLSRAVQADRLADVPTATPEEEAREWDAFNQTAHPVPDVTLAALIEAAMHDHPDATAVRFGDDSLDYATLDGRSAALAASLRARGAAADRIVAVALPRSMELVVALVAVLRAGAAYLPVDTDHPADRIAMILSGASPVAVLALDDPHRIYGDALLTPGNWQTALTGASVQPAPDDAAYVIYTSGSTGDPKGVLVSHRAIVNRLLWMQHHYAIDADDRILQKTPATFDVSVWEFFLPLISGATLVVAPPDAHRDPVAIARLIAREGVTALHFVPSMLAAFLDAPVSAGMAICRVFCSGEALPADLRDRFHRRIRGELHNLYGPTEAAVDVSYWAASSDDILHPVPIGHPVWNSRLVLLDQRGRAVAPGMTGHLHLGGVQLARGYLGRPDLTEDRFIADPRHPGERLYRSGDLARRRPDGAIIFLGRADHQVKLRGLRIELGEIEAAIAASGLTRMAVVVARDARLVAYVVPAPDYCADHLRAALARRLPDYMMPSAVVEMAHLPVTANGKLDRKALPAPRFEGGGAASPMTDTQARLALLYADLLDVAGAIGPHDDFFALGGDSLLAVKLMLLVEDAFGHDPGLAALFAHPDIAGLAACIDAGTSDTYLGLSPLITLAQGAPEYPPLFVVHPAGGMSWAYRALATALSPRRAVHGLQAPMLDPAVSPPGSIAELAADYARRIIAACPHGPVHLAGWSVGGIIAQAIAVQLREHGHDVGLVALLDSYPAECWRAEPEPTPTQALRALLAMAGHDPEALQHLQSRDAIIAHLRQGGSALGRLPAQALDGVIRVVLDTNRLVRNHHHRRYDGELTHIRAASDHGERPHLRPALWTPYAASIDTLDVPFLHAQLAGPVASAVIAPALAHRMALADQVTA